MQSTKLKSVQTIMPNEGTTKDENSLDSRFHGNDKAFTRFVIPAEAGIQGA